MRWGHLLVLGVGLASSAWAQTGTTPNTFESTQAPNSVFNVRSYGAKGDGKNLDSVAINRAITAATAAGGGTVLLPTGTYLSVSIHLKNNVHIHLAQGSVILAAPHEGDAQRYDAAEPSESTKFQDFGHSHWQNSLLWGEHLENVTIDGPGEIYGKGLKNGDNDQKDGDGNKAISIKWGKNINFRDFTIRHGGWFGILATGVDNLTVDNLKIDTNRDGMDIDCCRNVRVSNCSVNSPQDDGICLKSSFGLNVARPTEDVTITNCFVSGYDEGTMLDGTWQWHPETAHGRSPTGRIKLGTESNGGFKNITITNCVFKKCRGLALETVDGGLLEDVTISNITMRDITNAPIYLRLGGRMRGPVGTPVGKLRRVNISNVVIHNAHPAAGVLISGIPDNPIEDVVLSNIQLWSQGGGTKEQAMRVPPELIDGYPEPDKMGTMPSYGFYVRHVKGITVDNVQLHTMKSDERSPFALDDVNGAEFFRIRAERTAGTPFFDVRKSANLTMRMVEGVKDKQLKAINKGKF